MTDQPDAYTLAARAAADRARAEALQRGPAPTGPGLQNPMRRLSKNPAPRWVLSGVLLAAGTALAVDYLNVPFGAWVRYHAPVPGAGGKSVAQIAAEQSAAPQAKIDTEITAPAKAAQTEELIQKGNDEIARRGVSFTANSTPLISDGTRTYYPVSQRLIQMFKDGFALPATISDLNNVQFGAVNFLAGSPQPLPPGSVTPVMFEDGKNVASIKDEGTSDHAEQRWVFVKLPNDQYGAISSEDYKSLKQIGVSERQ